VKSVNPEHLIARTHLRFERQTTLGIPASWAERHCLGPTTPPLGAGCLPGLPALERALFTIRVTVQPLSEIREDVTKRQKLARVLRSMDAAALEYRGYTHYRDTWLEWLEHL